MFELERRGVPTVAWNAARFEKDARASARTFGLSNIALAIIPHPVTNETAERIRRMVADAIDQITDGLTKPVAGVIEDKAQPSELLKFQGEDLLMAAWEMNRYFLDQGWSDGFPLVPATRPAVEHMCAGVSLDPQTVICHLEPAFGIASVEKVAINAVMAGCRPEHLPVIITALQCLSDPKMMLRNVLMSTGPHAPLVLINGPIAKELKINAKCCALGPASISYANTVIGRALRLVIMNVGHNYPGQSDMDTLGSPLKYSLCVAENEEDNPWEPFHVEKGYDKDTSTVTVFFVYGMCDIRNRASITPEDLIDVYSTVPANAGHLRVGNWLFAHKADPRYHVEVKEHDLILLCPDHARVFARNNWTKDKIREALHSHARLPSRLLVRGEMGQLASRRPELAWLKDYPDLMLPVLESPDCYDIAIAGADVGRSAFFWGAGEPVTKPIEPETRTSRTT